MALFAISVYIKHFFVYLNSTVFKVFICENRKLPFLSLRHPLFSSCIWTQTGLPCNIAKRPMLLNMHWAARYFHPCSLKHENYCLEYFLFLLSIHFVCGNNSLYTGNSRFAILCFWQKINAFKNVKKSHYWRFGKKRWPYHVSFSDNANSQCEKA